jgi:hypothetical protein
MTGVFLSGRETSRPFGFSGEDSLYGGWDLRTVAPCLYDGLNFGTALSQHAEVALVLPRRQAEEKIRGLAQTFVGLKFRFIAGG